MTGSFTVEAYAVRRGASGKALEFGWVALRADGTRIAFDRGYATKKAALDAARQAAQFYGGIA